MKCAQLFAYSDLMKLCIHHNDLKIASTYFGFVCSLLCLLTNIISIVMCYLSFSNMNHLYIMKCISLYLFMKFAVLLFALVFRLPEIRMLEIERRIAFWTRVSIDTSYISIFCKKWNLDKWKLFIELLTSSIISTIASILCRFTEAAWDLFLHRLILVLLSPLHGGTHLLFVKFIII